MPDEPLILGIDYGAGDQSVSAVVIIGPMGPMPRGTAMIPPETVVEFEHLMAELDNQTLTRPQWERMKAVIALATMEAGDTERGQRGYLMCVEKWRRCALYDGEE